MTKCDQKTSGDNFFFNFMRIREGLIYYAYVRGIINIGLKETKVCTTNQLGESTAKNVLQFVKEVWEEKHLILLPKSMATVCKTGAWICRQWKSLSVFRLIHKVLLFYDSMHEIMKYRAMHLEWRVLHWFIAKLSQAKPPPPPGKVYFSASSNQISKVEHT